jgi:carbon-monoxide dehydrogenase large subunit
MRRRTCRTFPPVPYTLLARLSTEEAVAGREWPALVKDRVRYPGEAVAVVVGEDRYRAEDGAAEVPFTIDPLPAVVTPAEAADDSVRLFEGMSNVAFEGAAGEPIEESVWQGASAQGIRRDRGRGGCLDAFFRAWVR